MPCLVYVAVAFLTGVFGLLASGAIGVMAADWYHVSSFEGEAGYFVVLIALLGFVAGVIIALIACGWIARRPRRGFLPALGLSLGTVAVVGVLSGGLLRALADVPPELDGDPLLLAVEFRWPESQVDAPLAFDRDEPSVWL